MRSRIVWNAVDKKQSHLIQGPLSLPLKTISSESGRTFWFVCQLLFLIQLLIKNTIG